MRCALFLMALLSALEARTARGQDPDAVAQATQKIDTDLGESQRVLSAVESANHALSTCFPPSGDVASATEFAAAAGKARANFAAATKAYAGDRQAMQGFSDSFFNTFNAVTICGATPDVVDRAAKLNQSMGINAQNLATNCDTQAALAKKFHDGYGARTSLFARSGCGDAQSAVKAVDKFLTDAAKTCASLKQEVATTTAAVSTLNRRLQGGCDAAKKESELKLMLVN